MNKIEKSESPFVSKNAREKRARVLRFLEQISIEDINEYIQLHEVDFVHQLSQLGIDAQTPQGARQLVLLQSGEFSGTYSQMVKKVTDAVLAIFWYELSEYASNDRLQCTVWDKVSVTENPDSDMVFMHNTLTSTEAEWHGWLSFDGKTYLPSLQVRWLPQQQILTLHIASPEDMMAWITTDVGKEYRLQYLERLLNFLAQQLKKPQGLQLTVKDVLIN